MKCVQFIHSQSVRFQSHPPLEQEGFILDCHKQLDRLSRRIDSYAGNSSALTVAVLALE